MVEITVERENPGFGAPVRFFGLLTSTDALLISMDAKPEKQIAQIIQMACALEVCAPKPGNVSRFHDFPDASMEEFLLSAVAVGPAFENAARAGVGQIILDAVRRTRRWVRSNTNLGMILLFAPLAKACAGAADVPDVRKRSGKVLSSLTVEDARYAYEGIRLAAPGGLGHSEQADVAEEPGVTLLQAMALSQKRDAIAREYVTDFEITFEIGLPALKQALARSGDFSRAIVQAFLTILGRVPDTLIARKNGDRAARDVSRTASDVLARGGVFTAEGQAALAELDTLLRDEDHALNPGTTADLTAAAIFLTLFEELKK